MNANGPRAGNVQFTSNFLIHQKLFIAYCLHAVCALHEQRTLVVRSWKNPKIQIIFFLSKTTSVLSFPEGESPLCVTIKAESISKSQGGVGRPMH